ncbi:AAA family ATPase [Candidatus Curtissbacteria bacterium]|nr:AAA family ATPase [Candidatus Curtissbacteria bacterium]
MDEETILVQMGGGGAGNIELPQNNTVNTLALELTRFNLFLQRYVSAIWRSSDASSMHLTLSLALPQLPEGAVQTYLSTPEVILAEFREESVRHPRAKEAMRGLFMDLVDPQVSRSFGTKPHSDKFFLLTGREGVGKTLFTKALHWMLSERFGPRIGKDFDHIRLPLSDVLTKYRALAPQVVQTVLDAVKGNEANGLPTLFHVDNLDALMAPFERKAKLAQETGATTFVGVPTAAEFNYEVEVLAPIRTAMREFGQQLGMNSTNVIVIGESRVSRDNLEESVTRTFRRHLHLQPTVADLTDILGVQIGITREFAEKTGFDPFEEDIELYLELIARETEGLTGRDIQQALTTVATANKANFDGVNRDLITVQTLTAELKNKKDSKNGNGDHVQRKPLGFVLPEIALVATS